MESVGEDESTGSVSDAHPERDAPCLGARVESPCGVGAETESEAGEADAVVGEDDVEEDGDDDEEDNSDDDDVFDFTESEGRDDDDDESGEGESGAFGRCAQWRP